MHIPSRKLVHLSSFVCQQITHMHAVESAFISNHLVVCTARDGELVRLCSFVCKRIWREVRPRVHYNSNTNNNDEYNNSSNRQNHDGSLLQCTLKCSGAVTRHKCIVLACCARLLVLHAFDAP